jgi:mitogen-activated protein kinase 1/3
MTHKRYLFFRERVPAPKDETAARNTDIEGRTAASVATSLQSLPGSQQPDGSEDATAAAQNGSSKPNYSNRSLLKSASISASKCVVVKPEGDTEVTSFYTSTLFVHLWKS